MRTSVQVNCLESHLRKQKVNKKEKRRENEQRQYQGSCSGSCSGKPAGLQFGLFIHSSSPSNFQNIHEHCLKDTLVSRRSWGRKQRDPQCLLELKHCKYKVNLSSHKNVPQSCGLNQRFPEGKSCGTQKRWLHPFK